MTTPTHPNEMAINALMQQAIEESVFPGAVLLVARGEDILLHAARGVTDLTSQRPVTRETVYDLASLTKPLATTLAVMRLVQDGGLELDTPMGAVLPIMKNTDKAGVTVRQLLSHSSGWPAWQPYFERLRDVPPDERRPQLARYLADEDLVATPGTVALYSDLDFLALGLMIEACTGMRLDRYVAQAVYAPLGITDLFFNPLDEAPADRIYAATEACPWRGRVLCGAVHDDNAYTQGGVAGHAGLFGTARAVLDLLRSLLRAYREEQKSVAFASHILHTFWRTQPGSDWALGFDTPSARGSSAGRYFSANSVGHLGFTGTSFWLDIDRGIIVVLLSNRVHPSRGNEKIRTFRPRIHDAIMEGIVTE